MSDSNSPFGRSWFPFLFDSRPASTPTIVHERDKTPKSIHAGDQISMPDYVTTKDLWLDMYASAYDKCGVDWQREKLALAKACPDRKRRRLEKDCNDAAGHFRKCDSALRQAKTVVDKSPDPESDDTLDQFHKAWIAAKRLQHACNKNLANFDEQKADRQEKMAKLKRTQTFLFTRKRRLPQREEEECMDEDDEEVEEHDN